MMVLNEPETSLHPDLLPALAQLITKAADTTQVWVVTHSPALMSALGASSEARVIELDKELGQTRSEAKICSIGHNGNGWSNEALALLGRDRGEFSSSSRLPDFVGFHRLRGPK